MLNENIPYFKCLVRRSHFTHNTKDENKYDNAYAFAIQSVTGKILTFHVMTDYGMVRSRVPLSEIFIEEPKKDIPFYYKQLWDCFDYNVAVKKYSFLIEKRCQVLLRDKTKVWATYLFTVDWYDNPYSDEPTDYKAGHILVADEGYLLCMPNNRIYWRDSNWVTAEFPMDPKDIKVDKVLPAVESVADKWITEDTDSFYYDIDSVSKLMFTVSTYIDKTEEKGFGVFAKEFIAKDTIKVVLPFGSLRLGTTLDLSVPNIT